MLGYFSGYLRHEKPYCWRRPFHKTPIELYRCDVDRLLLTDKMLTTGLCAGHHIKQPAVPTVLELLLIYLGIIR